MAVQHLCSTQQKAAHPCRRREGKEQEPGKGLTFISTHEFLHHTGDLCVAKSLQLLHVPCCDGMLPHGCVHGWAEEQGFAQIPRADHTGLREKPREALDSLIPSHPIPLLHLSSLAGWTNPWAETNLEHIPAQLISDRKER